MPGGIATSENWGDIIAPNLFKVFDNDFNQEESMLPSLFNMQRSEKSEEKTSAAGGFGSTPEFTGIISYATSYQQYDVTMSHTEFAHGFQVERKLFDDRLLEAA